MRISLTAARALAAIVLILLGSHSPAWAIWPANGRAMCVAPLNQDAPAIASDGAGGAIAVWIDGRLIGPGIYAQHVLASGEVDPAWPVNGLSVTSDMSGNYDILPDGSGGAFVTWEYINVGVQHILSTGVLDPSWPLNGAVLTSPSGYFNVVRLTSDGSGGVLVAWSTGVSPGALKVFAQHVLSTGVVDPTWPVNARQVSSNSGQGSYPAIVSDGSHGAIVEWADQRSGNFDVYAQHVKANGTLDPAWTAGGTGLCTAPGAQVNLNSTIASDGAGGAIVAWSDGRTGPANHIYAQHVTAAGLADPAWPVNGLGVCTAGDDQQLPSLVSDGSSGIVVAWQDYRTGAPSGNVYAQRVLATGVVAAGWPVNGVALGPSSRYQTLPWTASDGAHGAIVTWQDNNGELDIYAQHVSGAGVLDPAWPADGFPVCTAPGNQRYPHITEAGTGAAIITWEDFRFFNNADIYAQQVPAALTTDVAPSATHESLALASPIPNPASGPVRLRFTLPREEEVKVDVYDVAGRRVSEVVSGRLGAGDHAVPWNLRDEAGHAAEAGLYFVTLRAGGRELSAKLVAER